MFKYILMIFLLILVTCAVWGVWLYMELKPWAADIKKRELDLLRRLKK